MADDKAQLATLQPVNDPQFEAKFNQLFSSVHTDASRFHRYEGTPAANRTKAKSRASMMPPASLAPWSLPLGQELPTPATAQFWLRAYTWTTWGVALALLVGVGFNELYITDSTFGATWWSDYMTLLAWGFGAEATRASITDLVRGWNIPVAKMAGNAG